MRKPIATAKIGTEQDIVHLRQVARQISRLIGFGNQDQIRIATSVSEIGRNALKYGADGLAEFSLQMDDHSNLEIRITDKGKGIDDLDSILNGLYTSETGLGLGIIGAKRLMDDFQIVSSPGAGTQIVMRKYLPSTAKAWDSSTIAQMSQELVRQSPSGPYEELRFQNQELLRTLADLSSHQNQLSQLNQELEETNRGVVALYTQLDEKSQIIQRNSEAKNRFLSNISHELRTPSASIIALARILLERTDGELTAEQEKQVSFILTAATSLQDMVNDLLDLAKVSAGKIRVKATHFNIETIFLLLRGMLNPLLTNNQSVAIVFDKSTDLPLLHTDESKVSQILKNFISNAIKYTESGEIRVFAEMESPSMIRLSVTDTGVGIDPAHHSMIFDEFEQVEGPLQTKQKGTGLGLPLSRKLAEILGGQIFLESSLGNGSKFSVVLPIHYSGEYSANAMIESSHAPRVLVVDDDEISRYLVHDALRNSEFQVLEASSGPEGIRLAKEEKPDAILLDLVMPGMGGMEVLNTLKNDPETKHIPVIINTSKTIDAPESSFLMEKAENVIAKSFISRDNTSRALKNALSKALQSQEVANG